ncbi:MAG: hypothetical protein FWF29_11155, partial [Treponema sp.]|nr:hypothetical protein [Treponema sp.]
MQNGLMQNDSEYNGRTVLGFDTGLDSQAFAQSKMAQFISQCGILVFPDGRTEQWKAVGVVEKARTINGTPTMVMWGPDFPGESLDTLVRDQGRKEEAIDAVKYYLKARIIVGNEQPIYGGACGVMVASGNGTENYPRGTILFMPERLTKRCIEAGGDDEILAASQWVHPDFRNDDLTVFSAAAMFYTILTGQIPFQQKDGDTLRQDIREGVFIPLRLAAPGLDKNIDAVITESLEPDKKKENGKRRPSPDQFLQAVGLPGSSQSSSWFRVLQTEEKQKIENELGQYRKNSEFTVKTRRFV